MASDLKTAFKNRHSYYDIGNDNPAGDQAVRNVLEFAALNTPSAFNSQSARLALLLGEHHLKLWNIVKETLRKMVPAESFESTDKKIDSFAAGHGTVLFYEDQATIEKLQRDFPLYKDAFPGFSMNSSGMIQHVVWVMLRDIGLGASLQHYGNLIEEQVAKQWNLPAKWRLIAQMPFGKPGSEPDAKDKLPVAEQVKVFA